MVIDFDDTGARLDGDPLPPYSPICTFCAHRDDQGRMVCVAFPNGIPPEIWKGENDHKKPYSGDHGIQFEERRNGTMKS